MSDQTTITDLLRRVELRLRTNRLLASAVEASTYGLGAGIVLTAWDALAPSGMRLGMSGVLVLLVATVGWCAYRAIGPASLPRAAVTVDQRADLHDEIKSAYWFVRFGQNNEWEQLQVQRAADTAREINGDRLVPIECPRGLGRLSGLAMGLLFINLLPLSGLGDVASLAAEQFAIEDEYQQALEIEELLELDEEQSTEKELEQALQELLLEEQQQGWSEEMEALLEDEQEPGEGSAEPEDSMTLEDPEGELSNPGDAETLEDVPEELGEAEEGDLEEQPGSAAQQAADQPIDENAPLIPAGEEVLKQEGGEQLDSQELGEEEVGHATKDPDGGTEQSEDEAKSLEVQLELEKLEAEMDELHPADEEPIEEQTRLEQSVLELQEVSVAASGSTQELLDAEWIPWRYRVMILNYFRTLHEREEREHQQEQLEKARARQRRER